MKAVLLAGGHGTRISEETHLKPKPMIEIGGKPLLWHIMKTYSAHNINEFIVCLGYKGYVIKEYFANYFHHMCDMTIDIKNNQITTHTNFAEPWKITLVDTGEETMTGGRLKRIAPYVEGEEAFCMTYGDGLSDVNITELVEYHRSHGRLATLTAVEPPERFGVLEFDGEDGVRAFKEKPEQQGIYINGGYFVLHPKVLSYVEGDHMPWERAPLMRLAEEGNLKAYKHHGFWQCLDTLRDKNYLENLWDKGEAQWKVWE